MRILLINPPWVKVKGNVWSGIASVMPPLGLAWIAAVLEKENHQVKILDAQAQRIDFEQLPEVLRDLGKFDIVGITATTALIGNAAHIAETVKNIFPQTQIILGGVHPTVLPEEVLTNPAVDIVVRGEGEETMREIATGKPVEKIDGISFSQNGKITHNKERALLADINTLPTPAYHLLPMQCYHPAAGAARRLPAISVLATRGCPGRCTFCYRIFGSRLRVRKGRKVAEEVKMLQEKYGIREICFYDDTFTSVKKEIKAFCLALEEMKLDLTWSCFSRVDAVDEEILRAMKAVGCHQIMYGIEAANENILKNIGKRTNRAKVEKALAINKKVGLDVRAAFMLGNPGETEETMEETLQLAIRINPELAIFNITTPFPGTEMFSWADEKGYLLTKNWEEYDLAHPVMQLPTVSPKQIQKFYRKVYRRFFLRPGYIGMRLLKLRSFTDIADAFRALRTVLGI